MMLNIGLLLQVHLNPRLFDGFCNKEEVYYVLDTSHIKLWIIQSPPFFNIISLQIKVEGNLAKKTEF